MKPEQRIIFALDFPSLEEAKPFIELLKNQVGIFKIGLELFIKEGFRVIKYINDNTQNKIFLDLKLLDIPATVEKSVKIVKNLNVEFLTVHAHDRQTLEAAVSGAGDNLKILGVTVLTSLDSFSLKEHGIKDEFCESPYLLVGKRAEKAYMSGCAGVICSPEEAGLVKKNTSPDFLAVTPGIRMSHNLHNDQKRVADPYTAVLNGADYIVVGRPLKNADNPLQEAEKISLEIERALDKKGV
jgi:orotidine-5'-phosphate decarboxylase